MKDEKRAEEFFEYYKERDIEVAFKWLPHCSIPFTEDVLQECAGEIPYNLVSRLCKVSNICTTYLHSGSYFTRIALRSPKTFLKDNIDEYLDMVEATVPCEVPRYGPKITKLLMKKRSERILKNLYSYSSSIHVPTFAKFIKPDDIESFIKMNITNSCLEDLFKHSKINYYVNRLPIERRYKFVKELLAETKHDDMHRYIVQYFCGERKGNWQNTYRLYTFATFDTAFAVMQDAIRTELNHKKKVSIFEVLLTCARKELRNVHALLKYYRENHINEPFKFKMQFVNLVINNTYTHKFDKETWGYLNDLFVSMDVYSEFVELDQVCVRSIILYNVIHGESISKDIEEKLVFDTFKTSQKKLSGEEREKLFLYLFSYLMSKLNDLEVNNKNDFKEIVKLLSNILKLLVDWNKELREFLEVLDIIKKLVQINLRNNWNVDISVVFSFKKSWRKLLFAESIILSPTQQTCLNALKHNPKLLETYDNQVKSLCLENNNTTVRFLKKVRIYCLQSLAKSYKSFFKNEIKQKNAHKGVIVGLCLLLPKNELLDLLHEYAPKEFTINWRQPDDVGLNLRKHIASSLHLARPQPSPATVLLYAKGDYVHFVLPSLNAILYNVNSDQTLDHFTRLSDASVSLQKHSLKIAFRKLDGDELKKLFYVISKTNNSTIRATFLNQAFDFLTRKVNKSAVTKVWELLSVIMKNSTLEENTSIYTKFSKVKKLPMSVRPDFVMKSYKFLKSLQAKGNCKRLLRHLKNDIKNVTEHLDADFAAEVFLESFEENFSSKPYEFKKLVVNFILSVKTEKAHMTRYNKVLVPILERSFAMWNKTHQGTNFVKKNLNEILSCLDLQLEDVVLQPPIFLIPSLTDILKRICKNLSTEENYVNLVEKKLTLDCLKMMNRILQNNKKLASTLWTTEERTIRFLEYQERNPMYNEMVPELSRLCLNYLKEDVVNYYPSIYTLFSRAFVKVVEKFYFSALVRMNILKTLLEDKDFIPGYLFVLDSMPRFVYKEDERALETELLKEIRAHPSAEIKMHYNCMRNQA